MLPHNLARPLRSIVSIRGRLRDLERLMDAHFYFPVRRCRVFNGKSLLAAGGAGR